MTRSYETARVLVDYTLNKFKEIPNHEDLALKVEARLGAHWDGRVCIAATWLGADEVRVLTLGQALEYTQEIDAVIEQIKVAVADLTPEAEVRRAEELLAAAKARLQTSKEAPNADN